MVTLTPQERDLMHYIDALIPENGHLEYDFRDPKQYEFAQMITKKTWDEKRYPGAFKTLELLREEHIKNGVLQAKNVDASAGWQDTFTIPGLGLAESNGTVASNAIATVVGGFASMNLTLIVQNNKTSQIVANGFNSGFSEAFLPVATDLNPNGSGDLDVTSYLHYSYTPNGQAKVLGSSPAGVVKRVANQGAVADPIITAPVRTTTNPYNPNAINIGVGRHWTDQGGNSQFDYAWNELPTATPIGKIPFVGNVTFSKAIQTPLSPSINIILNIYVANTNAGGTLKLDATDLAHVYTKFSINPANPNQLMWSLPPGVNTSDPGDPITFGNVTWPTDLEATFYCGITVMLSDNTLGFAEVQSGTSQDDNDLDGMLQIRPIEFIWHCLAEGTMVRMADGSDKPIEEIITEEEVLINNKGITAKVYWTNRGQHQGDIYEIHTEGNEPLITTHNHVLITSNGAVPAEDIKNGDHLTSIKGFVQVTNVRLVKDRQPIMCNIATRSRQEPSEYNSNPATFFANGLLVGDMNAQKGLAYQRRNDIDWIKSNVPEYLHKDVESYFQDKKS